MINAYEGVMMKEWNGIMDGCESVLNDLTIFISFHLCKSQQHARTRKVKEAHNDRTRAAVVDVLER